MDEERIWIVRVSLFVLAGCFAFFITAPVLLGFPLDAAKGEVTRVLQIVTPVFVAYLAAATAFLFVPEEQRRVAPIGDANQRHMFRLLTRGPVIIASGGLALASGVFWFSNRHSGPPGSGMSLDQYCWYISALLAVMATTTGIIVGKIFPGTGDQPRPGPRRRGGPGQPDNNGKGRIEAEDG
jgi:hypothetical protein